MPFHAAAGGLEHGAFSTGERKKRTPPERGTRTAEAMRSVQLHFATPPPAFHWCSEKTGLRRRRNRVSSSTRFLLLPSSVFWALRSRQSAAVLYAVPWQCVPLFPQVFVSSFLRLKAHRVPVHHGQYSFVVYSKKWADRDGRASHTKRR